MPLARRDLIHAYRRMKTIREFEERLHVEIANGQIAGFTHLYAGQEAVAVGVCENLGAEDRIVSTHRGHGHCIAKGCDVVGMMKENHPPARFLSTWKEFHAVVTGVRTHDPTLLAAPGPPHVQHRSRSEPPIDTGHTVPL